MLGPKEIDTYFNAGVSKLQTPKSKIARHTRKVMLAKLALPSIAAILAFMLLLIPTLKKDTKEFGLDFAIGAGEIEKLNVEKTTIYITDKNNRVNNFVANNVRETAAGSKLYDLSSPEAIMPSSDQEWINIKSPTGRFNQQTSFLRLTNVVEVFYSRGMNIQTQEATFDLKKSFASSNTPITGEGFIGNIHSEGFEFDGTKDILTFIGKTHIVINEETLKKD